MFFDITSVTIERNKEKDVFLQQTRGISFSTIIKHMNSGNLITIIPHHNEEKYPHQYICIVLIDDYMRAVPCVYNQPKLFLKTAYKDRNLTAYYLDTGS